MTKDARFNTRLNSKLLERAKSYAKRNHTTLAALIEKYLRDLLAHERTERAVETTGEAEQV